MGAISLSDCKVLRINGGYQKILIVTPDTADSNDTIDISAILPADDELMGISGRWDVTSGDEVTATYATGTGIITVDAAGGTTDHVYAIEVNALGHLL